MKKHQSDTDSPNRTGNDGKRYHLSLVRLLCNIVTNTVVLVKYFVLISKPFIANTTYPPTNHQRLGVGPCTYEIFHNNKLLFLSKFSFVTSMVKYGDK